MPTILLEKSKFNGEILASNKVQNERVNFRNVDVIEGTQVGVSADMDDLTIMIAYQQKRQCWEPFLANAIVGEIFGTLVPMNPSAVNRTKCTTKTKSSIVPFFPSMRPHQDNE